MKLADFKCPKKIMIVEADSAYRYSKIQRRVVAAAFSARE